MKTALSAESYSVGDGFFLLVEVAGVEPASEITYQ